MLFFSLSKKRKKDHYSNDNWYSLKVNNVNISNSLINSTTDSLLLQVHPWTPIVKEEVEVVLMETQQIEREPRHEERSELNQIIDDYLNNDDDSSGSVVESLHLKDIEVEQAKDVSVEDCINEDGNSGETTDETQSNEKEMDLLIETSDTKQN